MFYCQPLPSSVARSMARTLDLFSLIQQPESQRDAEWERAFFEAFLDAKVELDGDESRVGPDGWPYLYVKTTAQATEPVVKILEWLAPRGIGLVVNAHKVLPDYIFPYGMIWHFNQAKKFTPAPLEGRSGEVFLDKDKEYIFGPPAESYLPKHVRTIMRDFLAAQGVKNPKVIVISSQDYKQVDLVFSLESLGNPDKTKHQTLAEGLSWFLPMQYSLILASDKTLPPFDDL
jgi:hypothetical protein